MGKLLGIIFVMGGVSGYLYCWQSEQRKREERIVAFILFLQRARYAMETENIKVGQLLEQVQVKEEVLRETLSEIAIRLRLNIYPNGPSVWEEVFKEKEQNWNVDEETFGLMIYAGNGFFGKNKGENICFLQKSIRELEERQRYNQIKATEEKKVWVPVGVLGGLMLVILLI